MSERVHALLDSPPPSPVIQETGFGPCSSLWKNFGENVAVGLAVYCVASGRLQQLVGGIDRKDCHNLLNYVTPFYTSCVFRLAMTAVV